MVPPLVEGEVSVLCHLIWGQILAMFMARLEMASMSTLAIGFAKAKNDWSRVAVQVNRMGKFGMVLKDNGAWEVIQPAQQSESAVDVAVDLMDAYADVFEELAK